MGARQEMPAGAAARLTTLLAQAPSPAVSQRIQCVRLRAVLGLSAPQIAPVLDWQPQSVRRLQAAYLRQGEALLTGKPQGGRRPQNLTVTQEQEVLAPFLAQAAAGGVLVVAPVQAAYEKALGRAVHHSVVYRALHRQGWRKLVPRPQHPKASAEARETFQKSSPSWSRNK